MEKMTEHQCYVTTYHCDDCKPYLDTSCVWIETKKDAKDGSESYIHECKVCSKRHILNQIYPIVQIIKDDKPAILIQ